MRQQLSILASQALSSLLAVINIKPRKRILSVYKDGCPRSEEAFPVLRSLWEAEVQGVYVCFVCFVSRYFAYTLGPCEHASLAKHSHGLVARISRSGHLSPIPTGIHGSIGNVDLPEEKDWLAGRTFFFSWWGDRMFSLCLITKDLTTPDFRWLRDVHFDRSCCPLLIFTRLATCLALIQH